MSKSLALGFAKCSVAGAIAWMLCSSGSAGPNASWPQLQSGDILITRNSTWRNPVPGYYNHVAIYDGRGVVEAQIGGNSVRRTSLNTFYKTYPEIIVRRSSSPQTAARMAAFASSVVGQKYVQDKYTCVNLLRLAYISAVGVDPYWSIPDHVYRTSLFSTIGWK